MSKDFSSDQPKPQSRTNDFDLIEAPEPVTGFTEAPEVGLPSVGPGPGIPASNRKIH